ncbi:MarR family winged helix-turn-helix transcriptional regulator [Dechloromonas agitata]|uniref:Winged helix-turn-helix transcriptional regulator n=1 Tax=Dechloromonas agitata TaxID=73030 RepID=A0A930BR89_9RHOO|nr:MarR family winged helix-turn-helix transcriptional regulator [Dechloromonas agitata]MBF1164659.1 winged helix-turn-helix transcriptional regulator [Dechloromonas agitata]MDE1543825.1 MarR family winged helix-turn-helix transcriptional regulator [Dechloromonas agitata]
MKSHTPSLPLEVLQQFRVIYGTMRQYFRALEQCCGLPGSQMWILQEVERTPTIGVTELAQRLGIHQSTCSQLVDRLVGQGYLEKQKAASDRRRVGLILAASGRALIARLPGPAEGVLPAALASLPEVALKTLHINLAELIGHLQETDEQFARIPLAEMVRNAE